jgi:hypothetical protein
MATYYKYAERQEDAYVDWSVIGKQLSDSLLEEKKFREDKKAKIDEDSRQLGIQLNEAPQGQFQDGNKFTLQYASDAQQARLLQDKLLKSGQLSLKDYTVQRQNLNDGTSQVFDLAKLYQENYKSRMERVQKGELQAMNVANLASVEGFADFSKSQAVINPKDGTVNLAGLEIDPATGLKKVTNNIVPVSVLKGKILAEIPTFKVEEAMNKTKASLGTRVESLYKAATITGAGTITQLTGVGAIGRYPQYAGVIKDFNNALDNQVASWFSNPYNLSSVLTENLDKYNSESFTYDKEEAKADPSKILLKINTSTQLPTLDESGANYAAQKKEAEQWVKSSLLAKLDSEVKMTTTSQTQLQERSAANRQYGDEKAAKEKQAENFGEQLANLVSGDKDKVDAAVKYFGGFGVDLKKTKGPKGAIEVSDKSGNFIPYTYGNKTPEELQKSVVSALNVNGLPEDLILKYASKYSKGRTVNTIDEFTAISQREKPVVVDIPVDIFTSKSKLSSQSLQGKLPEGFDVEDIGGVAGNNVEVTGPSGETYTYNANLTASQANLAKDDLKKWIDNEIEKQKANPSAKGNVIINTPTNNQGTLPVNPLGSTSKYNKGN